MAGQTLLWDSRLRTVAVMIPVLGVVAWIASQFASEEFLIPGVILGIFLLLVTFTVFVQTIRFEAAVLCLLVSGYLIGNRGFADLTVMRPLYPGEFALTLIAAAMLLRFALTRELPDLSGWQARVIFVYCALGAVRLVLDYQTYKLDAIRDSAMVYYAAFFFLGRQLASQPSSKRMLERCIAFAFVVLVPIAVIERTHIEWLIWNGGFSPLYQKDDLLTTFGAMAVYIIYTRPHMYWKWLRAALILFYIVLVVTGIGRASLAALMATSILMLIAARKKFFLYPLVALLLGVTVLAGFATTFGKSSNSEVHVLVEKVTSMVDFYGSNNYQSDLGDQKAGTNDFRRKLWATFIDETNASAPVFGRGFGYDFVARFTEVYRLGEEGNLRSAHNFYITLFGRMGWIGIAVFAVLTAQIVVGGVRAALAVRAKQMPLADLGYWCATWVILVSSVVGVVLEGPVGAIVFWAFFGIAVDASDVTALAKKAATRLQHAMTRLPVPVNMPQRRPALSGEVSLPS